PESPGRKLGREERLDNSGLGLFGQAAPGVNHLQYGVTARLDVVGSGRGIIYFQQGGLNRNRACVLLADSFRGVQNQIHYDLLNLTGIALNRRRVLSIM